MEWGSGVLDNLQKIHERDTQGLLDAAGKQAEQLIYTFELQGGSINNVRNVVFGAMGGSALPALFIQSYPQLPVPFEIVRGYDLPHYVGSETLFIASSFSGNTEETLEAISQAAERGAKIAVITAGGRLRELAEQQGYLLAVLPPVFSRLSLGYGFRALLQILEQVGVLGSDYIAPLEQASSTAKQAVTQWQPEVATSSNQAKQIAQELMGRSAVIYSGPKLYPVAYKWKLAVNESAKQIAWVNQYPEFNHNEFSGWSKQPEEKPYAVVELRSTLEHTRIQKRFEVSERLLSGMRPAPVVVEAVGNTLLEQLVVGALLGDYVSIYLAIVSGLDPAPLELVDKLKQELSG